MEVDFEQKKASADIASVMEKDDVMVVVEHGEDGSVMRSEVHAASGAKPGAERTEAHEDPANGDAAKEASNAMPRDAAKDVEPSSEPAADSTIVEDEVASVDPVKPDGQTVPEHEPFTEAAAEPDALPSSEQAVTSVEVVAKTDDKHPPEHDASMEPAVKPDSDMNDGVVSASDGQKQLGDAMDVEVDVTGLTAQQVASRYAGLAWMVRVGLVRSFKMLSIWSRCAAVTSTTSMFQHSEAKPIIGLWFSAKTRVI